MAGIRRKSSGGYFCAGILDSETLSITVTETHGDWLVLVILGSCATAESTHYSKMGKTMVSRTRMAAINALYLSLYEWVSGGTRVIDADGFHRQQEHKHQLRALTDDFVPGGYRYSLFKLVYWSEQR